MIEIAAASDRTSSGVAYSCHRAELALERFWLGRLGGNKLDLLQALWQRHSKPLPAPRRHRQEHTLRILEFERVELHHLVLFNEHRNRLQRAA